MKMPVHFLLKSGEEFFVKKDGAALALRDEMEEIVKEPVLAEQMKDVIEYRAMDYYRREYKDYKALVVRIAVGNREKLKRTGILYIRNLNERVCVFTAAHVISDCFDINGEVYLLLRFLEIKNMITI